MNEAHRFLIRLWNDLQAQGDTIPFDTAWRNGTDYYNGAVDVKPEHPVAFQDDEPNSRRGVILPVGKEYVVFFERYTPEKDCPGVVVCNASINLNGAITYQTIAAVTALAGINPCTVGM